MNFQIFYTEYNEDDQLGNKFSAFPVYILLLYGGPFALSRYLLHICFRLGNMYAPSITINRIAQIIENSRINLLDLCKLLMLIPLTIYFSFFPTFFSFIIVKEKILLLECKALLFPYQKEMNRFLPTLFLNFEV